MFCPTSDVNVRYTEVVHKCCKICDCEALVLNVGILFSNRFTRRIGEARYYEPRQGIPARGLIRLSTKLFAIVPEDTRRHVVIHETCHLVADHEAYCNGLKIRAHGKEWKLLMKRCGVQPQRLIAVNQTFVTLTCNCYDGCTITIGQLTDMLQYGHDYNCHVCQKQLVP
jgi:predicted SprT family Zn-dependent metalloprotease